MSVLKSFSFFALYALAYRASESINIVSHFYNALEHLKQELLWARLELG